MRHRANGIHTDIHVDSRHGNSDFCRALALTLEIKCEELVATLERSLSICVAERSVDDATGAEIADTIGLDRCTRAGGSTPSDVDRHETTADSIGDTQGIGAS
jgi:hypothetical protein